MGSSWVNAGGVKGPARYRAVSDRVVALEHRNLSGFLLRKPVPLMVGTIGKSCGLTNTIVIDTIVGDVRLFGEGWPGTEHKGVLTNSFHGFG